MVRESTTNQTTAQVSLPFSLFGPSGLIVLMYPTL